MKRYAETLAGCAIALCILSRMACASEFKVVGPGGGGAMFHATINPHDANEVLIACDMTGAYISHDGGQSWRMFNLRGMVRFFAFDPVRPRVIYAGTKALWRSTTDGGDTWKPVLDRDQHVYDITIEPHDANILYAAGFESSAWRSSDRGQHWQRIPGFNFKWGHRVVADLADPKMIYVSTFGSGVWHGSSSGAEGHADIATPVMEPGH